MSYFRKNIEAMPPYVPGEQPAPGSRVIKLNTNENPYPPSPAVSAVLRDFDLERLRMYSDPNSRAFCQAAAAALGVGADWVLAGNGSDDLLAMIVLACAEPGRKVVYPMPTYVLYRTLAQMQDADILEVPYSDDYELPLEQLIAARGCVTFLARPNSPSGTCPPLEQVRKLAQVGGLVVVDEAYTDFAQDSALELARELPNVVVLRTLSKGYSLAGLRLGFAVGNPALLGMLNKVKDSYPVDAIACAVGAAAVADHAHKSENARKVMASRMRLSADLAAMGFRVWPSQANFLLVQPGDGASARSLYEGLKARGILIRYFAQARLDDKLRITVGRDDQNGELVAALRELVR